MFKVGDNCYCIDENTNKYLKCKIIDISNDRKKKNIKYILKGLAVS